VNKKIKESQHDRVPFMLIAGGQEVEAGTVTVRQRDKAEQETVPVDTFLARARALVESRALELG
jgi:threonyl-tRNA synthetase